MNIMQANTSDWRKDFGQKSSEIPPWCALAAGQCNCLQNLFSNHVCHFVVTVAECSTKQRLL